PAREAPDADRGSRRGELPSRARRSAPGRGDASPPRNRPRRPSEIRRRAAPGQSGLARRRWGERLTPRGTFSRAAQHLQTPAKALDAQLVAGIAPRREVCRIARVAFDKAMGGPKMAPKPLQTITPFLWFDGTAEEAMNFYVSIFPNSRTLGVTRYGESGPGPKGSVMTAAFVLNGQEFTALNGGPTMAFTPAISFVVHCETQAEVDEYWVKLTVGGQEGQCGWLTDRFGVSWQVVPN